MNVAQAVGLMVIVGVATVIAVAAMGFAHETRISREKAQLRAQKVAKIK